jgi:hypothetical protein
VIAALQGHRGDAGAIGNAARARVLSGHTAEHRAAELEANFVDIAARRRAARSTAGAAA